MHSHTRELTLEQIIDRMTKEAGFPPETMQVLGQLMPDAVYEHMENKKFVFSLDTLSPKVKLLLSVAVAAAIGSDRCTDNYVRSARNKGISKDEIMEALLLARFVKATTVIATAMPAMQRLIAEGEDRGE